MSICHKIATTCHLFLHHIRILVFLNAGCFSATENLVSKVLPQRECSEILRKTMQTVVVRRGEIRRRLIKFRQYGRVFSPKDVFDPTLVTSIPTEK